MTPNHYLAGRDFEILSQNDMGEVLAASPAISGGNLFIRTEKHVWCVGPK